MALIPRPLCLIYGDESRWATYSNEQAECEYNQYMAFTDDVRKSGHMLGGDALQATSTATTVRVRNGKVSTIDGILERRLASCSRHRT